MTGYNDAIAYNLAIGYNGAPAFVPPPIAVPVIEAAFGTDPLTTPGGGAWTDVTAYCRGFTLGRGRTHELDSTQAGEATVILKNTDRRFDPTNAGGPYYPNVVPMRRMRISVAYNAVTYRLFEGFVQDWGQDWPSRVLANAGDAEVPVKLVDAFGLFGLFNLTGYSAEVIADAPVAYWRLDEDQGIEARPSSGLDTIGVHVGTVVPGVGPGPLIGGQTVTDYRGDVDTAYTDLDAPDDLKLTGDMTIEAWVYNDGGTGTIVQALDPYALVVNVNTIRFGHTSASGTFEYVLAQGALGGGSGWHHVAAVRDSSARTLAVYVDGVLYDDGGGNIALEHYTRPPDTADYAVTLSQPSSYPPGFLSQGPLDGKLAHVAVYDRVLDPSRIAAHAAAPFDTFSRQATGTELATVLDLIGWPAGERDLDPGLSEVATLIPEGDALSWLLAIAERTEQGILRVGAGGNVGFIDRSALLTATSAATFGDGGGAEVAYTDIDVRYDDADLYSDVTVAGLDDRAATASDAGSRARYGPRTLEVSGSLAANPEELVDQAAYLLARYNAPAVRVERLAFLGATDGATLVQLFTRDVGDRITVKRRPPGGGTITQVCIIEKVTHTHSPAAVWETEWSLSPIGTESYFILNTSQLDGTDVLAY